MIKGHLSKFLLVAVCCFVFLVGFSGVAGASPQISGGEHHTIVRKTDGTLWAWGRNDVGQLGLGYPSNSESSPEQVLGGNDWEVISAGGFHTIARKSDRTLWAWGRNDYGQLGLGDPYSVGDWCDFLGNPGDSGDPARSLRCVVTPTRITGVPGGDNWGAISAGGFHTIARRLDGTLYAWGLNSHGQLGLGNTTLKNIPSYVGCCYDKLATGWRHTIARRNSDWRLFAWGLNSGGQLGVGDTDPTYSPELVGSRCCWNEISAGAYHTMALIDGALWAWGSNCVGHLGLGYCGGYRTIPTLVGSTYASVSAGGYFTIALKPYGPAGRTLWRWGYRTSTPTQITGVSGGDNNWAIIAAGYRHSIAMKSDGSLYGWGFNDVGQLGLGYTSSHIPSPTSIGLDLTP